jgi:cell division septum initiation protein DivIVA
MSESLVEHNNEELRAENEKLREELAEMEEQLAFREGELETAMSMLDDERVAKEEAQAEVARVKAKAQEEVNRIHAKAHEEVARIKGDAKAVIERNKANAQKMLDLANGQVKTERARTLAATFTLKKAQRHSRNHLLLKAALKVVSQDNARLHRDSMPVESTTP